MKQIIFRIFAAIGLLSVMFFIGGMGMGFYQKRQITKEPDQVILSLDFDQDIIEQNQPSPLSLALHEDKESATLFDILRALDAAKDDPHVKGIYAHFGSNEPSMAQAQEIRDELKRFRTSGKFTYAFGSDFGVFGAGNRTYYLASAFENIWLQPVGTVSLTGLGLFAPFGKTALDKIGITADFMQREEYKSFMDMGKRDDFAPPVRANMQDLVNDLADQQANDLAADHKWDAAHVKDLMVKGPYTDDEAMKANLITHIGATDELDDELKAKTSKDIRYVDAMTYLNYSHGGKTKSKAKVGLIYGEGLIMDHDGGGVDSMTGEHALGADVVAGAFEAAAEDKKVKAILFRIDSPGGSPSASETIRRAMMHAQKMGKPVFVSMGDVAASGGYWIAMNADRIVAEPGTLTGSIGVVSGKFAGKELLQKIGVSFDGVRTADNAGMWYPLDQFTPEQRERVNALLDNSYHTFTQDVATARKIPFEKMPDIAKGRVWTGAQASKIGLVDELGGYMTTFSAIRKKLGLTDDDLVTLQVFPEPETAVERLQKLLRSLGIQGAMLERFSTLLMKFQATVQPFIGYGATLNMPISATAPNEIRMLSQ